MWQQKDPFAFANEREHQATRPLWAMELTTRRQRVQEHSCWHEIFQLGRTANLD